MEDVNDFLSNKVGGGNNQRVAAYNLPCGVVSIDSTGTGVNKKYTVNYGSQTPCGYRKLSGNVQVQLVSGTAFKDTGAVFTVTFLGYKVEVAATGDIVTIDGTLSVTNVDGGHIWEAAFNNKTIRHRVRGVFNITYANNEVRSRSYYQMRTWSSTNRWAGLTFTVNGDTTISGSLVSETGKTYKGNYDYKTIVSLPLSWSNCGSTWAGPYVLKTGHAKMDVTVPNISTAYFDVEAGYYWDYQNATATPQLKNDCSSNANKKNKLIGTTSVTQYQLY
jgi:hypothetical protein